MGLRRSTRAALGAVVVLAALAVAACSGSDGSVSSAPDPVGDSAPATAGPTTTETPTTLDRPLRSFTVLTTGDFLLHMPVQRRALAYGGGSYDFSPMLAEVAGEVSAADLAICHMETPLSSDDTNLSGYPIFNSPREIADAAAAAGYDTCSTASNHSLDKGATGIASTLDQLDRVGLGHAGTARSAEEAARPDVHEVNGVTVAHLDYTYGTNGIPVPAGQPWLVNLIDLDRILADAHAARAAGAEVVVVEMHWGIENQSAPTPEQRLQAGVLADSPDIDLIIGQHVARGAGRRAPRHQVRRLRHRQLPLEPGAADHADGEQRRRHRHRALRRAARRVVGPVASLHADLRRPLDLRDPPGHADDQPAEPPTHGRRHERTGAGHVRRRSHIVNTRG